MTLFAVMMIAGYAACISFFYASVFSNNSSMANRLKQIQNTNTLVLVLGHRVSS